MSHEIRTPLTSIIGFAELLQDPETDPSEKSLAAETVVRNGRHLLKVVNDVLDLSKIESQQMTVEQVEIGLPKLLNDLEALVSSRAREKSLVFGIERHLPLPPTLLSDPVRLKQILLNLCGNAIKFSSRGRVRVDVHHEAVAGRIRFDVIDDGIGIEATALARLFQPFVQAEASTTRRFGGSGLGLYISRQLAEQLGATIEVTSTVGEGSCFSLSVPLGVVPDPAAMLDSAHDFDDYGSGRFQVTAFEVPSLSGRVLVAEDGPDNQRLLASYLRRAGIEFDIVGDGRTAVDRARAGGYALVLMDIQMPVMDGVAATRLLRQSGHDGAIVALTASVTPGDVSRYRHNGFSDVLAKPIDRTRFYEVLQRHTAVVPGSARSSAAAGGPTIDYEAELALLKDEFVAGLGSTFDEIEAAVAAGERRRLEAALHRLKGTAGSYGLHALSTLAAEIEARIAEGAAPGAIDALCARLRACAAAEA